MNLEIFSCLFYRTSSVWETVLCFSKGILPRELVSDGVLEYKISSSTIWNRCPWAGTDSSDGLDHTLSHFHRAYVTISAGNVRQFSARLALQWQEEEGCWTSTWPPSLTKADRFLLVFRVSIMSSTIWNRLQCGGTVNKLSLVHVLNFFQGTSRWQHCNVTPTYFTVSDTVKVLQDDFNEGKINKILGNKTTLSPCVYFWGHVFLSNGWFFPLSCGQSSAVLILFLPGTWGKRLSS